MVAGTKCLGERPSKEPSGGILYERAHIPEVDFDSECALVSLKEGYAFRDHSILLSDKAHVRPKAFSNIRIQDKNTFHCAENAMNVQARESVCH